MTYTASTPGPEDHRSEGVGSADALSSCPTWCDADLLLDDGTVQHISAERRIEQTAYPRERGAVWVGLERGRGAAYGEPTAVRLDGGRKPMTPLEALHLAAVLQEMALDALEAHDADPGETMRWARALSEAPTAEIVATYGYSTLRAMKIQNIVADLINQVEAAL